MKLIDKILGKGKIDDKENQIRELHDELTNYNNVSLRVKFGFIELENGDIKPIVQIHGNVYGFYLIHTHGVCGDWIPNEVKYNSTLSRRDSMYSKIIHEFLFYYFYGNDELKERLTRGKKHIHHGYDIIYNTMHEYKKDNYDSYFAYKTVEEGLNDLNYLWERFIDFKIKKIEVSIFNLKEEKEGLKIKKIVY